jgi:hypothetical protein
MRLITLTIITMMLKIPKDLTLQDLANQELISIILLRKKEES